MQPNTRLGIPGLQLKLVQEPQIFGTVLLYRFVLHDHGQVACPLIWLCREYWRIRSAVMQCIVFEFSFKYVFVIPYSSQCYFNAKRDTTVRLKSLQIVSARLRMNTNKSLRTHTEGFRFVDQSNPGKYVVIHVDHAEDRSGGLNIESDTQCSIPQFKHKHFCHFVYLIVDF